MQALSIKTITPETELSAMVSGNPRMIYFLEHFEIPFPLQGKTVGKICSERNIQADLFIVLARVYLGLESIDISSLSVKDLPAIIHFLENTHKYYLEEIYPGIRESIRQIQEINDSEGIKMLEPFFFGYFEEVKEHLVYEDEIAFPYISTLVDCLHQKSPRHKLSSYSVREYKDHHTDIEEKLNDLMNLLIKYLPHKNDQQLRRKLFLNLVELDYDLKMHARIEDLILIPLVEEAEQQIQDWK
jgi:regulator of cell morphogenesis and NO signaling